MGLVSSLVGTAVGGIMSKRQADKSSRRVRRGRDAGIGAIEEGSQQAIDYYTPYRDLGQQAVNALADPRAAFEASPGYEFIRGEGLRDLDNVFAMRGGGGNAMRAIADYTTNLAATDYGNWFNRQRGLAGMGQQAAGASAGIAANRGTNIANLQSGAGNALAGIAQNQYANYGNLGATTVENLAGVYDDWVKRKQQETVTQ